MGGWRLIKPQKSRASGLKMHGSNIIFHISRFSLHVLAAYGYGLQLYGVGARHNANKAAALMPIPPSTSLEETGSRRIR